MAHWVTTAHQLVNKYGVPNCRLARIKVMSQLNVDQWHHLLKDYKFNIVRDCIEFGFPLSLAYSIFKYRSEVDNHASARLFPQVVDDNLSTDKQFNAIVGPFSTPLPPLNDFISQS